EGFHLWIFRAARALWKCGRSESDIRAFIENAAATCGRYVSAGEIEDALRNSHASAIQCVRSRPQRSPSVDLKLREAIIKSGKDLAELWETSPVRSEDNAPHTEEIIDQLFPGNPLLCVGSAKHDARTAPREEWRGRLERLQFLVPNPMTAKTGRNK